MSTPRRKRQLEDRFVTEAEAAGILGFSSRSLQVWRSRGLGPPYTRVGHRHLRYRLSDLYDWMSAHEERRVNPSRPAA